MTQANKEFRMRVKKSGIKLWQIADKLSIHESQFSRLLRKELSGEMRERAFEAIDELSKEVG